MSFLQTAFFFFSFLFRSLRHEARKMKAEHQTFCPDPHLGFGSFYLKHHASIDCWKAELIARYAAVVWEQLRNEFPAETKDKFMLKVISDERDRRPGYKVRGTSIVVVNLARHPLDVGSPDFSIRELHPRDTLSEELPP